MNDEQSYFQKFINLLNTSSQTVMLIALVSLFAMPVVIAKNLEPMVRDSSEVEKAPVVIEHVDSVAKAVDNSIVPTATNSNVLGATTEKSIFESITESDSLKTFKRVKSGYDTEKYSLFLTADKIFAKTPLFTVKNSSTQSVKYTFDVKPDASAKASSSTGKQLFVRNTAYNFGSTALPVSVEVKAGEEITVSFASPKVSQTAVIISVQK